MLVKKKKKIGLENVRQITSTNTDTIFEHESDICNYVPKTWLAYR